MAEQTTIDDAMRRHARFMGRLAIQTSVDEIGPENVVSVLDKALPLFGYNQSQCLYLWRYFKGDQPILWEKTKDVRPEIDSRFY